MFTNRSISRIFSVFFNVTLILSLMIGAGAFPTSVRAASTITVKTIADDTLPDGLCSLREAITNANDDAATYTECFPGSGDDTILFDTSLGTAATITLRSVLPSISDGDGLRINGGGVITISGDDRYRGFEVNSSGRLTLDRVTVSNGFASAFGAGIFNNGILTLSNSIITRNSIVAPLSSDAYGGGIYNSSTGTLMLNNSTLSSNRVTAPPSTFLLVGGGIYNSGMLTVTSSTLTGNNAGDDGGGIYNDSGSLTLNNSTVSNNSATLGGGLYHQGGGSLRLNNSTVSNNTANSSGGGLYNGGGSGPVNLRSSIVAGNRKGTNLGDPAADCAGSVTQITSQGYNLTGTNTGCPVNGTAGDVTITPSNVFTNVLGVLASNGGATQTHALIVSLSNPAINAIIINTNSCGAAPFNLDHRGEARPFNIRCDMGAYEAQSAPPSLPTVTALSHPSCSPVGTTLVGCPPAGGGRLTITGTNFVGDPSTISVSPSNIAGGPITVLSTTQIEFPLAAGAGGSTTQNIVVTTNAGSSSQTGFTVHYAAPPTLTSITHSSCTASGNALINCPPEGGGTLTITGTNFYGGTISVGPSTVCNGALTINGAFTQISCTLGAGTPGTTTANIVVTTNGGTTSNTGFTIHYAVPPMTDQTITVNTHAPASAINGSSFTVAATASSGLPVSYSSSGACTNVDVDFTVISDTGDCTVMYDQAGDATYNPAPQEIDVVTALLAMLDQAITVTTNAPASAANGSSFTVAATASSGLPVSYSSSGSCTNSGADFTMISGTGTCTVMYDQAGDANYNPAPQVTETVSANAGPYIAEGTSKTVSMSEDGSPTVFALSLHANDADRHGIFTWSIPTPPLHGTLLLIPLPPAPACPACPSTSGRNIQYVPTTDYYGTDSFDVQVSDGTLTDMITINVIIESVNDGPIIVESDPQEVTMSQNVSPNAFDLTLHATDIESDPLTWSIISPASYGTATATPGVGDSNVIGYTPTASYIGTDSFVVEVSDGDLTATITVNVIIEPSVLDQTITVTTNAPASATNGSSFTVEATSSSGLPVSYSSSGACTNLDADFTMTGAIGTCTVMYDQAGDANYNPAPQVIEVVTAQPADQTITVTTNAPPSEAYGSSFTVEAIASSGLPVSYSASGACTNAATDFTMTNSTGTCTVMYDQVGDTNYNPAPQVIEVVTAQPADQTITVTTNAPASATNGSSFTVVATASSGLPVTYSSSGACTNVSADFTMTSATGDCMVMYDQAGDANYNPAPQVTEVVIAQPADQTITVNTNAPATSAYGSSFMVGATASSGLPVSYSASGACTNAGADFTMTSGTGTCTVNYDQAGDSNYNPAPQIIENVTAQKAALTVTADPQSRVYGAPDPAFTFAYSGFVGSDGESNIDTPPACGVVGVHNDAGTYSITCSGGADNNYDFVYTDGTLTVAKANQTITVTTNAPASAVNGTIFTVAATASSALPVSYSASGACTNAGATFTMSNGAGACTVSYDQAGNSNYNSAPQVTQVVADATAPTVMSSVRAGTNPTNAASVNFTVTFSESVTGVNAADFTLTTTGVSGAVVSAVSGSGPTYTVTVSTGTGNGTIRLNVTDNDSIVDGTSNRLGGAGAGNGNYSAGEVYTIDKTAPGVTSSQRANPNNTAAVNVNFTVTFSENVTGVDSSDFSLTTTGVTGAAITSVSGSNSIYTVTVNTGSGNGTIKLNLIDNDTILDGAGNKLGGTGIGNGSFTTGQTYTINKTLTYMSGANQDGWILESGENTNVGRDIAAATFRNNTATTFNLGDDAQDRQYRGILHFNTNNLPDNAVITSVTLQIKKNNHVGMDPFTTHQGLTVDISKPYIGAGVALQAADFNAAANQSNVGTFGATPSGGWYTATLGSSAYSFINLTGTTQFRLRFQLDDNDDMGADYVRFFSGDAGGANQPVLVIEYYVP